MIFNDLAEDKKGVGLIYIGETQAEAPTETSLSSVPTDRTSDDAAPATSKRIFISYGRADAEELALRLEKDLAALGHAVWLDKKQIRNGHSWEAQIEQAILDNEVLICLLTPHAVRRRDGVCLDEISMARFNNRQIVPATVLQCRPPLGIFRLDYVDFQSWRTEAGYKHAFERLNTALRKQVSVEGVHAHIFGQLKPLDFGLDVTCLVRPLSRRTSQMWCFNSGLWVLERHPQRYPHRHPVTSLRSDNRGLGSELKTPAV